ncbi:MAG: hypothetical protein IKG25_04320 [Mogibacterium sp.]|nr:hypothetical protein [Mogibacterium sp.]
MVISICPECRRKLMDRYDLIEPPSGKEFAGVCQFCFPPRETMLRQYDAVRKSWTRPRNTRSSTSPPTKDRRARYREPFRGE